MFSPVRILAVTLSACGCLLLPGPAHALGRSGKELAQPTRKQQHVRPPHSQPAEAAPPREVAPQAKPEAKKPSPSPGKPLDIESSPSEEEEVSPGDSPASCDGCELAGLTLGGSLWGLFGVRRKRNVPRPVIRGFQPG